jgi:hypothetical protein
MEGMALGVVSAAVGVELACSVGDGGLVAVAAVVSDGAGDGLSAGPPTTIITSIGTSPAVTLPSALTSASEQPPMS